MQRRSLTNLRAATGLGFFFCALAAASPQSSPTLRLPLVFEEAAEKANTAYLSRTNGLSLRLAPGQATLQTPGHTPVTMRWLGGNPAAPVTGEQKQSSVSHYYLGRDAAHWRLNVPHYAAVRYQNVYPGIDLVFHGATRQLEYDFVLQPGADPNRITLAFDGVTQIRLEQNTLILHTKDGELRQPAPVIYQQDARGQRHPIAGRYTQKPNGQIGFALARYDRTKPLVIDPTLSYASYFGGPSDDAGRAVAVDATGNIYVAGNTTSADFVPGRSLRNLTDGFVLKLDPTTSSLLYITYIGGSGHEDLRGMALDGNGNVYLTGRTGSLDFPTSTNAYIPRTTSRTDSFAVKLSAAGQFLYGTYLAGNSCPTYANAIAVDANGRAFIGGATATCTNGSVFPATPGAYQTTLRGPQDGFVTVLNATGTGAIWSSLLGGSGSDQINTLLLTGNGNATVAGGTTPVNSNFTDFPTTPGVAQPQAGGIGDGFVAQFDSTGASLAWSTLIGGLGVDEVWAIAADAAANIYATGSMGVAFPTKPGAYQTAPGSGFVVKFNPTATAILYSTSFGLLTSGQCPNFDLINIHPCGAGNAIAVDTAGRAYVTGSVADRNFPITAGSLMPPLTIQVDTNTFLYRFDADGSHLDYGTFYGGLDGNDYAEGLALDNQGNVYLVGTTRANDLPVSNPAVRTTITLDSSTLSAQADAFVAKIAMDATVCTYAVTSALTLPVQAGSNRVDISAPAGCPWSVAFSAINTLPLPFSPWASTTVRSGIGNGTIPYDYSANFTSRPRTIGLAFAGQSLSIVQAAAPCTMSLLTTGLDLPASGGSANIDFLNPTGCPAPISTDSNWLTTSGPSSDSFSARSTLKITAVANPGAASRTALVTIGTATVKVTQAPASCSFSFTPANVAIGNTAGTGTVTLSAGSECDWNLQSSADWLTADRTSGSGGATIQYTYAANTGSSRTATLKAGSSTFVVTQAAGPGATPVISSLSPAASSGTGQVLTVQVSDADGYQDLNVVNVLINRYLTGRGACYLAYSRAINALYLVPDDGDAANLVGKVMDGTGSISNSQCAVDLSRSSASGSGNTLTLTLNLRFSATFDGDKVIYVAARDQALHNSGWQLMGVHKVAAQIAIYPQAGSVTPAAGSGTSQTFTFTFEDFNDATNLFTSWVLINSSLDNRNACSLAYYQPGNLLYLLPDNGDGTAAQIIPLSGTGIVSNSQCSITAQGSSVTKQAGVLTLTLPITFKSPAFSGHKGIWLADSYRGVGFSAWQALGVWQVP